jgi:Domain of unknown function (4846)
MKIVTATLSLILLLSYSCASVFSSEPVSNQEVKVADTTSCNSCRWNYSWMPKAEYDHLQTVCNRFPTPNDFTRMSCDSTSFGWWLRGLPLRKEDAMVHLYNGNLKQNQSAQAAVVNIDVGKSDLQQCADAVMRFRAEYLFSQKKYDQISFNYTSGDRYDYLRWTKGRRISVQGNKTKEVWNGATCSPDDYTSFRKYLNEVFMYAGTLSLSRELKSIPIDSIQAGDVFIHGGSPGHAELVVDVALNEKGGKVFLLLQSYMPAQEAHILRNPESTQLSPWYSTDFGDILVTPEYEFSKSELMRF